MKHSSLAAKAAELDRFAGGYSAARVFLLKGFDNARLDHRSGHRRIVRPGAMMLARMPNCANSFATSLGASNAGFLPTFRRQLT